MKISIAIAFLLSMFTASVAVFATNEVHNPVHVVSVKAKDLFVFKTNRSWQGAQVEVLALNGECVSCQKLSRRKMIINFQQVKSGSYRIVVTKNDRTEEFRFTKN